MSQRKMVVGLGNPGPQYAKNRHNIGFQSIDLLARRHAIDVGKIQLRALTGSGMIRAAAGQAGVNVLLVKPITYMNASGEAVGQLARFYQIEPADILVIHDDIDLAHGKLRLRVNGSSGGQNGIKSIIQQLGTPEFSRVKVGMGRPPGRMDAADYVLHDFSAEDEAVFGPLRQQICDAVECWLFEGSSVAMNRYNATEQKAGDKGKG